MNYVKIYCTNRVFHYKSFLLVKKIVYEVLNSCLLSQTCTEYIAKINLFLASRGIFSFSTVSTPMPPSSAFLYYTTIFVKSITPYWFCAGFQLAGTPPPYTASILHHHALVSVLTIHRIFPTQGSTLFWNLSDKIKLITEIDRYTKIQIYKINKYRQYNPELHGNISINLDIIISIIPYRVFNIS